MLLYPWGFLFPQFRTSCILSSMILWSFLVRQHFFSSMILAYFCVWLYALYFVNLIVYQSNTRILPLPGCTFWSFIWWPGSIQFFFIFFIFGASRYKYLFIFNLILDSGSVADFHQHAWLLTVSSPFIKILNQNLFILKYIYRFKN